VQLFLYSPDAFAMALKCSGRLSEKYLHRQHCLVSLVISTIQLLFDVLKNFVSHGVFTISKNSLICKTKKRIQEQKKKCSNTGLYRVPDHFLLVKDLRTCYDFT
jgi:hypothetical protein